MALKEKTRLQIEREGMQLYKINVVVTASEKVKSFAKDIERCSKMKMDKRRCETK